MKPFRLLLLSAILAAAVFTLVAAQASACPPPRPFVGAWEAIDLDGSHMQTSIGGGRNGEYHIVAFDAGASVCGLDASGQPLYAAMAIATGQADGNVLHAELPLWCLSHPRRFWGMASDDLIYDPGADTLFFWGVTWHHKGVD